MTIEGLQPQQLSRRCEPQWNSLDLILEKLSKAHLMDRRHKSDFVLTGLRKGNTIFEHGFEILIHIYQIIFHDFRNSSSHDNCQHHVNQLTSLTCSMEMNPTPSKTVDLIYLFVEYLWNQVKQLTWSAFIHFGHYGAGSGPAPKVMHFDKTMQVDKILDFIDLAWNSIAHHLIDGQLSIYEIWYEFSLGL